MIRICLAGLAALTLSGCSDLPDALQRRPEGAPPTTSAAPPPPPEAIRAIVSAPPPPPAARTQDSLDTTTAQQRQAAAARPAGQQTRLGETVASLGDPTMPGFWIKTPLASEAGGGRLEYPATGKSAVVQLIPLEGPSGGGSQVSLAAMRLLGAPLTDLPTLVVYGD